MKEFHASKASKENGTMGDERFSGRDPEIGLSAPSARNPIKYHFVPRGTIVDEDENEDATGGVYPDEEAATAAAS